MNTALYVKIRTDDDTDAVFAWLCCPLHPQEEMLLATMSKSLGENCPAAKEAFYEMLRTVIEAIVEQCGGEVEGWKYVNPAEHN